MAKAVCDSPRPAGGRAAHGGRTPFAWLTRDLSASEAFLGDATLATPEKGARLLDSLAAGWARSSSGTCIASPTGRTK